MRIVNGDICETTCDAIVNASNGIGFMGGKAGIRKRRPGVAESIHYMTQGQVEQEAKQVCRGQGAFGFGPGQVFVTSGGSLQCRYIIHAVTMRYPGTYSSLRTVEKLLPNILAQARSLGIRSIAIPLLGTGTGHVDGEKVLELYRQTFEPVQDLDICVYVYRK